MTLDTEVESGPPSIDRDYLPLAGIHDEMLLSGGEPRPHWQSYLRALRGLSLPELTRRWSEAAHLIRENGITYNVYGDPRGQQRPWQLDPVPLLIPAEETASLEAGLVQRARLLNAILADLYGPQRLLHEGCLPAELVFGHPGFLRPCHGIVRGRGHLHLLAADLGRGPDGQWYCLGDRTQAPSGAGYALENRIVLSRILPDLFQSCGVQRLARFFRDFRDRLNALAAVQSPEGPRTVLLTPGPLNETYFEHAFLASYLGFTLVEGTDLTVRDSRVYLKVLGGLQPVDVILRRLDGDFCDPLELRPDSFLGVPGLVQAVRSGHVAVVNALGSGLVETPALFPYLPALCRRLLGEELRLPSVPTWWCGHPPDLQYVLDHLDQLVIKPAFARQKSEPLFGDRLTEDRRQALIDRIRARPGQFVAQQILPLSAAPVLVEGRLAPRPVVLRTFLAARGDSFELMPGGLTRFSARASSPVVSMQSGGGSKDTWVLATGEVNTFSLLPSAGRPVELSRAGSDLPSRVADNLFWLGRYTERAEGLTRLLRGVLNRLTERAGLEESAELPILARALPRLSGPLSTSVPRLVLDQHSPESLVCVAGAALRAASAVRDRISIDMWRVLSELERILLPPHKGKGERNGASRLSGDLLDRLDRVVLVLAGFGGLAMESMTRGVGWRFLNLGRKLERALSTIHLVERTLGEAHHQEGPLLEAILEIADCSMTYRRRYQGGLATVAVLDLLLADESNPRSVVFQARTLAEDVQYLPAGADLRPEQELIQQVWTSLRLVDVHDLAAADSAGRRAFLIRYLDRLVNDLPTVSDLITRHYLTHLLPARHLGMTR